MNVCMFVTSTAAVSIAEGVETPPDDVCVTGFFTWIYLYEVGACLMFPLHFIFALAASLYFVKEGDRSFCLDMLVATLMGTSPMVYNADMGRCFLNPVFDSTAGNSSPSVPSSYTLQWASFLDADFIKRLIQAYATCVLRRVLPCMIACMSRGLWAFSSVVLRVSCSLTAFFYVYMNNLIRNILTFNPSLSTITTCYEKLGKLDAFSSYKLLCDVFVWVCFL